MLTGLSNYDENNKKNLLLLKLCREDGVESLVHFMDCLLAVKNRNEGAADHLLQYAVILHQE